MIDILGRYPEMKGDLCDLPHVVERARANEGAGRCEGVNFSGAIPVEADAYFLRHLIHDWGDERAVTILRNVRGVMGECARLLAVQRMIPPGDVPMTGKLMDPTMLVVLGGMGRMGDEFRRLLEAAGFRPSRIVPTTSDVGVIEGNPGGTA